MPIEYVRCSLPVQERTDVVAIMLQTAARSLA